MPDAYTGVGATNLDQTAYDLAIYYALRPELYWDPVATVRSTNQSFNGAAVIFTIQSDLSAATTTLAESTDVSAVAMSDSQVTVTLAEYGNAVITTALARGTVFIPFDPIVADVVGYNAGLSLDGIARNEAQGGSNVYYADTAGGITTPGARNTIIPTDLFTSKHARRAAAQLRGANVRPINGYYVGYIHPDVAYDASWRRAEHRSSLTPARARRSPTCTRRSSSGRRRSPRRIPTWTATARCRPSSPVPSPTSCGVSSRSVGTGSAATSGSVKRPSAGTNRRAPSARTPRGQRDVESGPASHGWVGSDPTVRSPHGDA